MTERQNHSVRTELEKITLYRHKDGGRLIESTYGHPSHADALAKIKNATGVAGQGESPHLRVAPRVAKGGFAA